ncbi:rod shape-determining protein [Candidatus Woesebacteria bacterium]|jgi:rod shape-determining protein MreB|nr:rod shape-determining protein [Candidatus Woesebacteria bacterium]MBP9687575.1 rod shape-determining protein [Candidatus Woesebacteria bacterium]
MINRFFGLFSHDVGIDLGTANTLVFVSGKGIAIREPSVVARHKKTREILAIGTAAKKMVGRTPGPIEAVRPLKDGVIADFDATEAMLSYYIRKVHEGTSFFSKVPRPRVIIGIPSGVTEVERRAVADAAISAGARRAYLVEEPMAAAIGAGLPVWEPEGVFIVDIGGGTTDIALISLGGIVIGESIRVAGDEMDEAIINYFRLKYSLLVGQPTAENVKIQIGTAIATKTENAMVIRGRDLETGLPKSIKATGDEIREAIHPTLREIVDKVKEILEEAPPELVSDVSERGITLAGGGAMIAGIDKMLSDYTKIPVHIAENPITAVARGCGVLLSNEALLKKIQVTSGLKYS